MRFRDDFTSELAPGMVIPEPLMRLFDWIEERGLIFERNGTRVGTLFPIDQVNASWSEAGREGGTLIEFFAEGNVNLPYWFGEDDPVLAERMRRVCVIGKSGSEGSMLALWLDGSATRIVHMGSGSGSTLVCVLGESAVEFLRLLAIGYDEICWGGDEFEQTPKEAFEAAAFAVVPNEDYRRWVEDTFQVAIPGRGIEIVKAPAEMGDLESADPFIRWVERCIGE